MSILYFILILISVALMLLIINKYAVLSKTTKLIITLCIVAGVIVWLLMTLGALGHHPHM